MRGWPRAGDEARLRRLDRLDVVRRRLHRQRLASGHPGSPAEVVGWLGAMQAQEFAEAKWSIAERLGGATDAEVEEAFSRGEIVRTHVLRPTWHFVAAADVRWLLGLTAPRVQVANRYRHRQLGLGAVELALSLELIAAEVGAYGPRTRAEIGAALEAGGVDVEGQRLAYIVMHAELEGLLVSGPRRGRRHTYTLLEDRVPEAPSLGHDDALAELTRRYFSSHGPATVRDFRWWSGLTVSQVQDGLALTEGELASEAAEDGTPWYSAPGAPPPEGPTGAFLIPMFDELTVAYQDQRMVLAEQPEEGDLARAIVIDGLTVGSWKRRLAKRSVEVEARLFTRLDAAGEAALEAAVARFGDFLGLPATLTPR